MVFLPQNYVFFVENSKKIWTEEKYQANFILRERRYRIVVNKLKNAPNLVHFYNILSKYTYFDTFNHF